MADRPSSSIELGDEPGGPMTTNEGRIQPVSNDERPTTREQDDDDDDDDDDVEDV